MPVPLIMPKFEMTQEYGTVAQWLRKEGDWVEKGEPVLEVETDKVLMEVEAPASGYLLEVQAQIGQIVPVTNVVAYIFQPDEVVGNGNPPQASIPKQPSISQGKQVRRHETPLARRVAAVAGIDIHQVSPAIAGGRVTRKDVDKYLEEKYHPEIQMPSRTRATPAARRVAREHQVDLSMIAGSGPRNRIQEMDVQAAVQKKVETTIEKAVRIPPIVPITEENSEEVFALEGMRRAIAEHILQSYQTAPHVTFTVEVDMSKTSELRRKLNQQAEAFKTPHISVTAILVKVCAWTLPKHPWLNASLRGRQIHRFKSANIGVAVALQEGLIVPVIQRADRLSLSEIARYLQDLSDRAIQGRLIPEDVSGGTFTISNLGMFGIDQFTAILNPPQSAILAVGRLVKKPLVIERESGNELVIHPVMKMTLSVDHRIVDGAVAALFLKDVVAVLENPDLMLF